MKRRQFVGLQDAERSEISILQSKGYSVRAIARALGRSPNTISYEIKINSVSGVYDPLKAKAKSRVSRRSRRYQWQKIERHSKLRQFVIARLEEHWSPAVIAGYLKHEQSELPYVNKDQIYAWLYSSRGQLYCQHLLSHRYRSKKRKESKTERVMIPGRLGLEYRPTIAGKRGRVGDWEGDAMVSGKRTGSKAALAVFQERSTRFIATKLLPNLKPETFAQAAIEALGNRPAHTLTLDNGIENKQWQAIARATDTAVFFTEPYASWQKGSVEHANKMLRRYLPKSCDLAKFSQSQIDDFVVKINTKPRAILGYKSALQLAYEKGLLLEPVS